MSARAKAESLPLLYGRSSFWQQLAALHVIDAIEPDTLAAGLDGVSAKGCRETPLDDILRRHVGGTISLPQPEASLSLRLG